MYEIRYKTQFKKDLKKIQKRSKADFKAVFDFIKILEKKGCKGVPPKNKPHMLTGNYKNYCEAHIKPDLLIIWKEHNNVLIIELANIGSHSSLF